MEKIRILHIEDFPADAELIQSKLLEESTIYEFKTVDNKENFLKGLDEYKPDLVISDFSLPGINGKEVIKIVKKINTELPVIIVTGTLDEETAVELMKAGAADYVLKENLTRLSSAINNSLQKKIIEEKRALAEKQMLMANERMQYLLFSTSAIIYSIKTNTDYEFSFLSENIYQMMHYKANDILATKHFWLNNIHPEDRERIQDESKIVMELNRVTHEYRFRRKDDSYIWLRDEKKLIRDLNDEPLEIIGNIINITDYKMTEHDLQESEELYRSVVSSMAEGIVVRGADGKIRTHNKRAEEILGLSGEQMVGNKAVHPDWKTLREDGTYYSFKEHPPMVTLQTGMPTLNAVMGILKPDKSLTWISINSQPMGENSGKPLAVVSSFNDITQIKLAQEELKKSEERYRSFFENDISGVYVTTVDGEILDCNPSFIRILGFESIKDAKAKNAYELYSNPKERDEIIAQVKQNKHLQDHEVEMFHKDGSSVFCIQNLFGIFDSENQLQLLRGYLYDITERKQLEEQLRQSQKLEGVGQLAGGIAHDFNNILTVINGYSELLIPKLSMDKALQKIVNEIKTAGERAASLTAQLLAFSRHQVTKPQIININKALESINKMLNRLIGENIEIKSSLNKEIYSVKIDPGQFDQIIINLVVNARDAMPDGGRLTIETKNIYLDESYSKQHVSVNPGDYVLLSISDTGEGMNEETRQRIFEPFFTTKELGKGTGLGLATVYGIVKQVGGNIWVYSESHQGTTFKIFFPAIKGEAPIGKVLQKAADSLNGSETILIVEDDPAVRELTCGFLESYGYDVLESRDVDHAIEIAKTSGVTIHLLITDVIMPKMSGRQLANEIQLLLPQIKVLFVTGYADNSIIHHGILDEGVNLLTKPFSPNDLANSVRKILNDV
jgi:PAS domain S-box-containing protein